MIVREYQRADTNQLLSLMRDLAVFEGYINQFKVTEQSLQKNGLGECANFRAFVAQSCCDGPILGYSVAYIIPWTYDLKPTVVLKEMYVEPATRGKSVGKNLLNEVKSYAKNIGASYLRWTVLNGNINAEAFYSQLGGRRDLKWNNWLIELSET